MHQQRKRVIADAGKEIHPQFLPQHTRRPMRAFSVTLPDENMQRVTSRQYRMPFSRCSTQPVLALEQHSLAVSCACTLHNNFQHGLEPLLDMVSPL